MLPKNPLVCTREHPYRPLPSLLTGLLWTELRTVQPRISYTWTSRTGGPLLSAAQRAGWPYPLKRCVSGLSLCNHSFWESFFLWPNSYKSSSAIGLHMACNDAPSAKVPPFPDQFQDIVEPFCNPISTGLPRAHTIEKTLLNTVIAVKGKQIGDDRV